MNAPVKAAALKPQLELVAVDKLIPSKLPVQAMRRARFTDEALRSLADDIRRNGITQAPLVRPLPDGLTWEIVAGERRCRAAKLAGLAEIYVSVRPMTDDQALEAQLGENLERVDLHELEEAESYEQLMKLKKLSGDGLVTYFKDTKSRSTIYARLKLLALCPEARKSFYAGELDASRALLIARIGHHDTQRRALKEILEEEYRGEGPMSYRQAHAHIVRHFMLALKTARFDIKDASLLPKAGDCIKCPKRTGNQADLFSDVKGADVCTDPKCFDDKRQAHHAKARKKFEDQGRKVIAGGEAKKLMPHWENNNDYIKGDYLKLDDSDYINGRHQKVRDVLGKDYVPTMIQHPLSGKFIEIAPRSTVHAKAAAKTKDRSDPNARGKATVAAANKRDKARALEQKIEDEICEQVFAALSKKITAPSHQDLQDVALFFARGDANLDVMSKVFGAKKVRNQMHTIQHHLKKLKGPALIKAVFLLYLSEEQNRSWGPDGKKFIDIEDQLARYKVDPKAIEKEVRAKLTPKPVDKVNTEIDKRAAKAKAKKPAGKGILTSTWPFPTSSKTTPAAAKKPAKKKAAGKKAKGKKK